VGADSHMPKSGAFKDASLNDDHVVKAYILYCQRMIERFDPAFFAYAIEVSALSKYPEKAKRLLIWRGRFTPH